MADELQKKSHSCQPKKVRHVSPIDIEHIPSSPLQALQSDFPCTVGLGALILQHKPTLLIMDSTTENKGVTSFTCKRKEFQDALKSVKNPFMRVLSVKTRFAENKILLNIDGNDYPVPCTENTGNDATFNASIDGMKRLCKNVKEESYQFFIYEDNVEMNLHHLYKSSYNGFSYYDFY